MLDSHKTSPFSLRHRVGEMKIKFLVFVFVLCCLMVACNHDEPTMKNRMPSASQYADQARQAASDAKAAADAATKARQEIDAAIKKLNSGQRDSSGEPKEGRPEQTAPGTISEFGSYRIDNGSNSSDDYYLGFTFTDRYGFTKRFFPVCPNTTVKVGTSTALMYHWQHFESMVPGQWGCYKIDGQQSQ